MVSNGRLHVFTELYFVNPVGLEYWSSPPAAYNKVLLLGGHIAGSSVIGAGYRFLS